MAKREAEEQLTLENFHLQDDLPDEIHKPKFASAAVMAKRKILNPRGRGSGKAKPGPSIPILAPSAFLSVISPVGSDLNSKISALNAKFVDAVVSGNAPLADYRVIAQKYIDYYASIESANSNSVSTDTNMTHADNEQSSLPKHVGSNLAGASVPQKTNPFAGIVETEQTEKKNPFASIAFGQTAKPISNEPPKVKQAEVVLSDDNDSEDEKKEVTIDGPKFTMTTKPTIKNSPFTFGSKPAKKPSDDSSDSEVEIKGPSFTFSKSIQDPVFKLGGSNKPSGAENLTPAFTFGKADINSTTTKALESLSNTGIQSQTQLNEEKPLETPSGASAVSEPVSKSPFSFGSSNTSSNFGFNSQTTKKPAFTFGQSSSTTTGNASPAPFGALAEPKPAFQFGAVASQASSAKPAFLFGSTAAANPAPSFQFGASSGAATPLFSFGTSTFNSGQQAFGQTPSVTGSQSTSSFPKPEEGELMPEEETGGDFAPVASLGNKKVESTPSGEENEEVLFYRKSKLMLLDSSNKENPYKNLGIGELKVLKNAQTQASRILVRADGGLRVLLNVGLMKDMTYSTMGNGSLVRVPAVNSEGALETYVLKVKTPADGAELCETLNQANLT